MENAKNDIIVVLGAAVWKNGVPSPSLERRIKCAIKLLQDGRSNRLLVTGGLGKYPPSEASTMQRLAMEAGVSEKNIVLEELGTTTWSSAKECTIF
jgi:vancomycin permeability regulator SanA